MKINGVSISEGNAKMGAIMSVSLPPVITCKPGVPCIKKCYARRMMRFPNVKKAWNDNYIIARVNPDRFFNAISEAVQNVREFRYHVAGDILNMEYFKGMVRVASENKHCKFLCFTKKHELINEYVVNGGIIPENLVILFSVWDSEIVNPYRFPEVKVIFKGETTPEAMKICGGNCMACRCRGVGCWELKRGETLGIFEH